MARAAAGRSQAAGASLKQLGEQSVPSDHPPPSGKCQLESCDQNMRYLEFGTKEISHLVTFLAPGLSVSVNGTVKNKTNRTISVVRIRQTFRK